MASKHVLTGRLLVVAFEGWNDAGEAASGAVKVLKDSLALTVLREVDPEQYFDYQFNRPVVVQDDDGRRRLDWPSAILYGPSRRSGGVTTEQPPTGSDQIHVLLGAEPSRSWKNFTAEILDAALVADIGGVVLLGAMLADVPHTRPISVFTTSENSAVRSEFGLERSSYQGPVGILSVIADAAEALGIPTVAIWASVPHYVHNAPSPKATLALIEKLEEIAAISIPRGDLADEATAWESGIDQLAGEDEDMAAYIAQLEQARDTVDSPEASGEAIAQEFQRYLRRAGDGRDGRGNPDEPWRPGT